MSGVLIGVASVTIVALALLILFWSGRIFKKPSPPLGESVLIVGSYTNGGPGSVEIYSTLFGTFGALSQGLASERYGHTATQLGVNDGRVLIAGGYNGPNITLNTAELYDPITNTLSLAQTTMLNARANHTATKVGNGSIVLTGGEQTAFDEHGNIVTTLLNTIEIFGKPGAPQDAFVAGDGSGIMPQALSHHVAVDIEFASTSPYVALLITGSGFAFLYEFGTGDIIQVASPDTPFAIRSDHTGTRIPQDSHNILIAGGFDDSSGTTHVHQSADLYVNATNSFVQVGPMTVPRYGHSATALPDGRVLVAGGWSDTSILDTAELFDPVTRTFVALPAGNNMVQARVFHTATLLNNGLVLVAGGQDANGATKTAELFNPANLTFMPANGMLTRPRDQHTATVLLPKA
jgi:hypothetical protein